MSRAKYDKVNDRLILIAGKEDTSVPTFTMAEWEALTDAQKAEYDGKLFVISDDFNGMTVDDELSDTSVHPVQNKVITEELANCAEKTDLTSIRATGSTNTTGATITSGTYFYLNNTLVVAIQNISNSGSFTKNTNYEEVTAGALNKKGGVNFNRVVTSFTGAYTGSPISGNVDYTLTEDSWLHIEAAIGGGYLQVFANSNRLLVNWANYVSTASVNFSDWVLLPKGTRVTMTLTPDTNKVYSWSLQFYAAF